MEILIVIPARGGSKGIPRKNLRLLSGKPLLFYSINNALESKYKSDIYISSEDDEIINVVKKFGVKTHKRKHNIADDKITLDPVIFSCYEYAKSIENKEYELIVTMQPTSPLLSSISLDYAIEKMITDNKIDTVIAAKDMTHLSWSKSNGEFIPNYSKRVNRQYLTPSYTETGAFLITRGNVISENNRIGHKVELVLLNAGEEIDIDTYDDWNLCEYYLKRQRILFVVTGNNAVGLGHVYNTLLIANDILNHQILFLVDKQSELAYQAIKEKNYSVYIQKYDNIIEDIHKHKPNIVINDILDTTESYVNELKHQGYKVINFEDLGDGAKKADIVFNAIYPEKEKVDKYYFGQDYFILRDEFVFSSTKTIKNKVKIILITFGGVDSNNYTHKVISTINKYCIEKNITIKVIAGFGYSQYDSILKFKNVEVIKNVSNISDYMLESDLIFTSAGRTIYEIASICTPAIVLAQNEREITHFFASGKYGFLNLGLGHNLTNEELLCQFRDIVESVSKRTKMSSLMKKQNLKSGRQRVNKLINDVIESK